MMLNAYSIRDSKSEVFSQPFFCVSHGVAIRSFADVVNDSRSEISKHPNDYTLFAIGTFDDSSGIIMPLDKGLVNLGLGSQYLSAAQVTLPVADPAQLRLT